MEITITTLAQARAAELAGWNTRDLHAALAAAEHQGVSKDGLEVWWAKGEHRALVLCVRPEGLVGCRPVRLVIVTVMPLETTHGLICRTRDTGRAWRGWVAQERVPDPWAVRRPTSPARRPGRAA